MIFLENPEFHYKIHNLMDSSKERGWGKREDLKSSFDIPVTVFFI